MQFRSKTVITLLLLTMAAGCTEMPLEISNLMGVSAPARRKVSRAVASSNISDGSANPSPSALSPTPGSGSTESPSPGPTPTKWPKPTPWPTPTPWATPTPWDLVGEGLSLMVSTFAGGSQGAANGVGIAAQFNSPNGIAFDSVGNAYVADAANHSIRKITASGEVSTIAGGTQGFENAAGSAAKFNSPYGLAVDGDGNVFVADTYNHSIRKITPVGGVETIAGNGAAGFKDATGTSAQFNLPFSVDVDDLGNIYVADAGNHRIRKISPLGVVSTLAGVGTAGRVEGEALLARFSIPNDVAVDSERNLYVADFGNHCIRKISFDGNVSTLVGNGTPSAVDGVGATAQFNSPTGVALDGSGNIYVADNGNNRVRKVSTRGQVLTLAGTGFTGADDGPALDATFDGPTDIAVNASGLVVVSDTNNNRIRTIK